MFPVDIQSWNSSCMGASGELFMIGESLNLNFHSVYTVILTELSIYMEFIELMKKS